MRAASISPNWPARHPLSAPLRFGLYPYRSDQQATLHQGLRLLMEEDAQAGRPFLAALVGERRGDRPWVGFSREARRLGGQQRLFLPYGTRYTAWRRAVAQVYRFYRIAG